MTTNIRVNPRGSGPLVWPTEVPATITNRSAGTTTGADAVVSLDADAPTTEPGGLGLRGHVLSEILFSYVGATGIGRITVESPASTFFVDLDCEAPGLNEITFNPPWSLPAGQAAVITLHGLTGATGKIVANTWRMS